MNITEYGVWYSLAFILTITTWLSDPTQLDKIVLGISIVMASVWAEASLINKKLDKILDKE